MLNGTVLSTSMQQSDKKTATLLLEDGTLFKGIAIGKIGTAGGEFCFNTGMTGYQEIYTDPSYYGQIVVNTHAHIGNYGVASAENESAQVQIKGLVVRSFSRIHTRPQAQDTLQGWLEKAGIVGIAELDTRALVRHLRTKGAMNGIISSEDLSEAALTAALKTVPDMAGLELSSTVSTAVPYTFGQENAPWRVAVLDLGIKRSILHYLAANGCYCKVFPAKTSYTDMAAWQPDGFFISNGPGDPAAMPYAIQTVRQILASAKPLFGICLGHQMLALACGVSTYKMHHGHRGLNHPVKNLLTGLSEITSQNHGFNVDNEQVRQHPDLEVTHINLNDGTVEGIRLRSGRAFSVQYHPEASPGPHDAQYLFAQFAELMGS